MKIALPWILAAALLAGLVFLYSSARQKDTDLAQLRQDNEEIPKLRAEIDELKKAAVPADEITRLRKDNEDLLRLRNEVRKLRDQSGQLSNQLVTAQARQSQVQQQQQQQTAQLAAENQSLRQVQQSQAAIQAQSAANVCINNLRQIDGAKQQWALENKKPANAVPTFADIAPYLGQGPQGAIPTCPSGGAYTLNTMSAVPTCSIPGHALPKQ
jgi:chromosome segregation ATPase